LYAKFILPVKVSSCYDYDIWFDIVFCFIVQIEHVRISNVPAETASATDVVSAAQDRLVLCCCFHARMKSATTFVLIRASKLSFTAVITRFSRHQNSRGSNQVVVKKSYILHILMTSPSLDLLFSTMLLHIFFLLHLQGKKKPLDVFPPTPQL
jgi:hypothetical protein